MKMQYASIYFCHILQQHKKYNSLFGMFPDKVTVD